MICQWLVLSVVSGQWSVDNSLSQVTGIRDSSVVRGKRPRSQSFSATDNGQRTTDDCESNRRGDGAVVIGIRLPLHLLINPEGARMYPVSRRKYVLAVVFASALSGFATVPAHAHGGGGHGAGHGGGGHQGSYGGGGYRSYGGVHTGAGYVAGPQSTWIGFHEDLPEARIRRLLVQHLTHPRLGHWLLRGRAGS
jgi:hypothetical protein